MFEGMMERKREGWMGRKANKRMDSRCRKGKAKVVEKKRKDKKAIYGQSREKG